MRCWRSSGRIGEDGRIANSKRVLGSVYSQFAIRAATGEQDHGRNLDGSEPELSREAVAAALAKMSKEEQTLTLIKASYATPMRIAGSPADIP